MDKYKSLDAKYQPQSTVSSHSLFSVLLSSNLTAVIAKQLIQFTGKVKLKSHVISYLYQDITEFMDVFTF